MSWFMIRETLGMAGGALFANRLRSLLALLGIVIGVGTVIGMVALINGFQRSFQQSIRSLGSNTIYIRTFRPGQAFAGQLPDSLRKRRAFSLDDAAAIRDRAPAVVAVSPIKIAAADIRLSYRDRTTKTTTVFGSDDGMLRTRGFDLSRGRFYTAEEVEHRANVVVLGKDTHDALFTDASGLGASVHLNGIPFTVIGTFEAKGRFLGNNFDEIATIPWTVADKYWAPGANAPSTSPEMAKRTRLRTPARGAVTNDPRSLVRVPRLKR